MRTLYLNKRTVWMTYPLSKTNVVDGDGNFTGEVMYTYATPVKLLLNIRPLGGEIALEVFGDVQRFDKMAVTEEYDLPKDALLFYSEPVSNYDKTYDLKVMRKMDYLNSYAYGLAARV